MNLIFKGWLSFMLMWGASATAKSEVFKEIKVKDLVKMMASQQPPSVYDANTESTRKNAGIIPGAQLLDSSSQYDVKKFLPPNKTSPLVFYCANTFCTASHDAAKRAIAHDYKNVFVMVDGIFGWKEAKQKVEEVPSVAKKLEPQSSSAMAPKEVFEKLRAKKVVVVDVREHQERFEIVEGSLWIPMSKVSDPVSWSEFKKKLDPSTPTIFYCASGGRSPRAAARLAQEGFKAGYFDGPDQWQSEGLPLVAGPAKK